MTSIFEGQPSKRRPTFQSKTRGPIWVFLGVCIIYLFGMLPYPETVITIACSELSPRGPNEYIGGFQTSQVHPEYIWSWPLWSVFWLSMQTEQEDTSVNLTKKMSKVHFPNRMLPQRNSKSTWNIRAILTALVGVSFSKKISVLVLS